MATGDVVFEVAEKCGASRFCWVGWCYKYTVPPGLTGVSYGFSWEQKVGPDGPAAEPPFGAISQIFKNEAEFCLRSPTMSETWQIVSGNCGPFSSGDVIKLKLCAIAYPGTFIYVRNFKIYEEEVPDIPPIPPPPPPPPDDIAAFCLVFGYIAEKMEGVAQLIEDVGDWFEQIWVIGDQIKTLFYAIAGLFRVQSGYFFDTVIWCDKVADAIGAILSWGTISEMVTSTWAIVTYTPAQLVAWIRDSLESSYDVLTKTISDLATSIADVFESSYEWFFKSTDDFKAWLFSTFESSYDVLTKTISDLAASIADVFESSYDWFFKSTDDFKAWLFSTFESSIEWFFKSTDDFKAWLFSTLESSIEWFFKSPEEFINWVREHLPPIPTAETLVGWLGVWIGDLVEAGLEFVGSNVERFKGIIWDTIEKVVKKL